MTLAQRRKPGRPPNAIPTIDWKVRVPVPLAAKIDVLLLDPVTGATRQGARSEFVSQLLGEYLARRGMKVPTSGDPE